MPSDGWAQLLFYRKDLFEAAGLKEPTTVRRCPGGGQGTEQGQDSRHRRSHRPADSFTQQTFEWVALANGCQLVDGSGNVTLNSPQCQEAFNFYGPMMKDNSVSGNQDADTRATYFAAMRQW